MTATEVTQNEIPWLIDEIPVLACLACRSEGETVFRGVGELRVKESDRLARIIDNLRAIGGEAWAEGDDLFVVGDDRRLSGTIDTGLDHRIAMAFATLGVHPNVEVRLSETESPRISYPDFFRDLKRVTPRV